MASASGSSRGEDREETEDREEAEDREETEDREEKEEDALSACESFQSADDDDDFDLPQDFCPVANDDELDGDGGGTTGGALPPGLDSDDGGGVERWNLRKDGNKEQLEPIWVRLSTEREHVKISKMFSYVLRHAAHKLDVRIRKDGFVRLREIMKLRNFKPYTLEELMAVAYFDDKERYTMVREFDGELLIRANQGHTMKVVESDLLLEVITDGTQVAECVHGTYLVHWPFIKTQGLSKVARNHIHLANGLPEDGKIRGMRNTAELFVYIDVVKAMDDGVVFYRSKNDVILTPGYDGWLPVKYFQRAIRMNYNTCDIEELEFEPNNDMPTWAAELAPTGPGEQGTYLIKNLEALISNCRKRLQEINELRGAVEQGRELDEEEAAKVSNHSQVYTELQSLEQRFRQHKGHRRESAQEKEQRAKEEAEAGTVVKRKDRAVTPPWERGKTHLKSVGAAATEKEKAEWSAIGRKRENATAPPPKKEDPWSGLGRARLSASGPTTPSNAASRREAEDERRGSNIRLQRSRTEEAEDERRGSNIRLQRSRTEDSNTMEGSWRFKASEDKTPLGRQSLDASSRNAGGSSVTGGGGGPPRFFNSKKSTEGSSWRDRMTQGSSSALEESAPPTPAAGAGPPGTPMGNAGMSTPSWRASEQMPMQRQEEGSWRDRMVQPQYAEDAHFQKETMPPPPPAAPPLHTPAPPALAPAPLRAPQVMATGHPGSQPPTPAGSMPADGNVNQYVPAMPMWQHTGAPQMYYMATGPPQDSPQVPSTPSNWMGQVQSQYMAQRPDQQGMGAAQQGMMLQPRGGQAGSGMQSPQHQQQQQPQNFGGGYQGGAGMMLQPRGAQPGSGMQQQQNFGGGFQGFRTNSAGLGDEGYPCRTDFGDGHLSGMAPQQGVGPESPMGHRASAPAAMGRGGMFNFPGSSPGGSDHPPPPPSHSPGAGRGGGLGYRDARDRGHSSNFGYMGTADEGAGDWDEGYYYTDAPGGDGGYGAQQGGGDSYGYPDGYGDQDVRSQQQWCKGGGDAYGYQESSYSEQDVRSQQQWRKGGSTPSGGGKGGGSTPSGKGSKKGGGKGKGGKGGLGKDRGDDGQKSFLSQFERPIKKEEEDWAALGRMRAAA